MQRASMQRDGTLGHAAAREAFPQQAFEVLVLQQKAGRATLQLGERPPRARLIRQVDPGGAPLQPSSSRP